MLFPHQGLKRIHCRRVHIPSAIAKILKERSKVVLVVRIGYTEGECTRDWVVSPTNMTLNMVLLQAGENVYQEAKGQPMTVQSRPTKSHYRELGREQADATDFVCVNRMKAETWRECFAVSPVDIGESEDQREGKGRDKA